MPPPLGGSSGGLPSRVEYLSPQGVLLPLVYGTTASPLWLELRGHSAWQVTPSWTVYRLACHRLLPWLRVTFAMVPEAGQGDSVGPPHPHTRAHSTWMADPNSPPRGRAVGGGTAPDLRRPSQWWKAAPPRDAPPPTPQRATPARKGARCGAAAGSPRPHRPHPGHTGRGTLAARSRGQAAGGGTAPDTRRPPQRWQATPPRGRPPTTSAARSPHGACRPRGQCWAPTPTHLRPQHVGGGPQQPAQWAGSRGRDSA